ncbi:MAG: DUF3488 and transglutaminase-like domain-containing protein [Planctomycetaceae bacterium]
MSVNAETRDRQLRITFYRSITIVISAAAALLASSEGRIFPSGLTPLIALAGMYFVDYRRWANLPTIIANVAGLGALTLTAFQFSGTNYQKLLSGTHLLVYLTWIVLFMRKGHRQFWWLIALSVLQVTISGILSTGVGFGAAVFGMTLLLLWTLSVFSLFRVEDEHSRLRLITPRKAGRKRFAFTREFFSSFLGIDFGGMKARPKSAADDQVIVRNGLQRDPSEVWIGWRFRGMVGASYLVSLVLAIVVFAAFPRVWVNGGGLFAQGLNDENSGYGRRTGFNESVRLGDIGQLMTSNARAFSFEVMNVRSRKPVSAEQFAEAMNDEEVRFRGSVLAHYADGRWSRGLQESLRIEGTETQMFGRFSKLNADFEVAITLEPPIGNYAFAPYPVSGVLPTRGYRIEQRTLSSTLVFRDIGREPAGTETARTYSVQCPSLQKYPGSTFEYWTIRDDVPKWILEPMISSLNTKAARNYITDELRAKLPRLTTKARQLTGNGSRQADPEEKVRRIMEFLSPQNGFRYSLKLTRSNADLDPIEDFLFETKSGHCEYFASACVLMLQASGIPARLVNGYYGSEYNSLNGKNEVRQHHAHSWVEAWVNQRWITLDPTPGSERTASIQNTSSRSLLSSFQAAINDLWTDGINNMSAERQKEFFAPVLTTTQNLWNSIREQGVLPWLKNTFSSLLHSPDQWISWQGGLVTFLLLGLIGLLHYLGVVSKLLRWIAELRQKFSAGQRTNRSVIRFYELFCQTCEQHGLKLASSNTALENAAISEQQFSSFLSVAGLNDLPRRIASAFNKVRFGEEPLSSDEAAQLGRDVSAFATSLQQKLQPAVNA